MDETSFFPRHRRSQPINSTRGAPYTSGHSASRPVTGALRVGGKRHVDENVTNASTDWWTDASRSIPLAGVQESFPRNLSPDELEDLWLLQQKVAGTGQNASQTAAALLPGNEAHISAHEASHLDSATANGRWRPVKKQRCSGPPSQGTSPNSSSATQQANRSKRKRSAAGLDLRMVLKCHGCHRMMGGGYKFGDYVQCANCGENEFIVVKEWSPGGGNRTSISNSGCPHRGTVNCMTDQIPMHSGQR